MRRGFISVWLYAVCLGVSLTGNALAQQACAIYTDACACASPCMWSGSICTNPFPANHMCDDGSLSGTPSVVSSSVTGANAAVKFQSVVNKKLACCLNSFDSPAQLKYDCVDNSGDAVANFDDLWTKTDPADAGAQPNAIVLSNGASAAIAGKAISGFYTLAGARCAEFSEFAGIIRTAKVNPNVISGQQNQVNDPTAPTCAISAGTYSVTPPTSLMNSVQASGKKIPYDGTSFRDCVQAQNMRRCPILVRAAMIASCPRNPAPPQVQPTFKDAFGALHCISAANVRIHIRIEQIYEIAGMPSMPIVDTVQNSGVANFISVANIIQAKVGTACPANTSLHNGACMGCPAGCGGQQCHQCPANTYSDLGATQCTSCTAPSPHSPAGSTTSSACTP